MFWESKCRREFDLGLCTTSGPCKRMLLCSADFQQILHRTCFLIRSRHCTAAFFLQVPKLCTDLDRTLLYILVSRTYDIFVRKNKLEMLALGVCRYARALAAGLPRIDHVWTTTDQVVRFYKNKFDEMRFKLDFTENPRSFERYPALPWVFTEIRRTWQFYQQSTTWKDSVWNWLGAQVVTDSSKICQLDVPCRGFNWQWRCRGKHPIWTFLPPGPYLGPGPRVLLFTAPRPRFQ